MLADSNNPNPQSGRLNPEIHLPSTAKLELVSFIAEELPRWRDDTDRALEYAETKLTEHLCDYLNSAARTSSTWDHIQFRTEVGDETRSGRKIDLAVKPLAAVLIIEGRRHSQFDMLFPIECKRLPTPTGRDRDKREYVITEPGTTGGIQRFKLGHHGAAHNFAAMIAYVQEQSCSYWLDEVNCWIKDLAKATAPTWSDSDILELLSEDLIIGINAFKSEHQREGGLNTCELRHLWLQMHRNPLGLN
jgi:hypothetical protein